MGSGADVLFGVPTVAVLMGLISPIALSDGGAAYLMFLWRNPVLVITTMAAWWVLFYWCTRRIASVLLLRSSGAKLRVGDATHS